MVYILGRQLAFKISANAIYGFTGAKESKLQCLQVADTTIMFGYKILEETKEMIEKIYCRANGYKIDCKVVYGDTGRLKLINDE
jgi:DNA polymerase delta subunit 1